MCRLHGRGLHEAFPESWVPLLTRLCSHTPGLFASASLRLPEGLPPQEFSFTWEISEAQTGADTCLRSHSTLQAEMASSLSCWWGSDGKALQRAGTSALRTYGSASLPFAASSSIRLGWGSHCHREGVCFGSCYCLGCRG